MAEDRHLLTDLRLELRQSALRPVYTVATDQRRVATRQGTQLLTDLATITGRKNLGQAIVLRLLTPRGELAALAHPEYGSRLHELIGRQNTATTLNLVRLFILESLGQERRVQKVTAIAVEPVPGTRDRVAVRLQVQPIGAAQALDLGPFLLEL